jgi:lysophospholipase L1-like esterase
MRRLIFLFLLLVATLSFSPERVTWIAIGDSITYLNDHQNETGNRITKGYMTRVVGKLPNVSYTNQGHNGLTAARVAQNIEKLGLERADIYSIFLGTNDWWQGRKIGNLTDYQNNTGDSTLYGSFRIIINKIRNLNPTARIILITPMQRGDFVYINNMKNNAWGSYKEKNGQSLSQFVEAIRNIGRLEKLATIDLYHERKLRMEKLVKFKRLKDPVTNGYRNYPYPQFIDIPFHPENDEYPYPPEAMDQTYDGLHPSDKGYAIISDLLVKEMKKHLIH